MTTHVYIDLPPRIGSKGPRYTARLGSPDGEIIANSLTPLLTSSRVLFVRGIVGRVELWDSERPYARASGEIEKLMALTVRETRTRGPEFERLIPIGVPTPASEIGKSPSGLPQPTPA
jgi:hypothetical protein